MNPSNENEEVLEAIRPYLHRIIASHPQYGSAGLTIIFAGGDIARIDISETVQRKLTPRATQQRGDL